MRLLIALILIAAGGSAALLLGAFGFQYLGDMPPCPMCLWQRWPHAAAVLIGVLALVVPGRILPLALAMLLLTVAAAVTDVRSHRRMRRTLDELIRERP